MSTHKIWKIYNEQEIQNHLQLIHKHHSDWSPVKFHQIRKKIRKINRKIHQKWKEKNQWLANVFFPTFSTFLQSHSKDSLHKWNKVHFPFSIESSLQLLWSRNVELVFFDSTLEDWQKIGIDWYHLLAFSDLSLQIQVIHHGSYALVFVFTLISEESKYQTKFIMKTYRTKYGGMNPTIQYAIRKNPSMKIYTPCEFTSEFLWNEMKSFTISIQEYIVCMGTYEFQSFFVQYIIPSKVKVQTFLKKLSQIQLDAVQANICIYDMKMANLGIRMSQFLNNPFSWNFIIFDWNDSHVFPLPNQHTTWTIQWPKENWLTMYHYDTMFYFSFFFSFMSILNVVKYKIPKSKWEPWENYQGKGLQYFFHDQTPKMNGIRNVFRMFAVGKMDIAENYHFISPSYDLYLPKSLFEKIEWTKYNYTMDELLYGIYDQHTIQEDDVHIPLQYHYFNCFLEWFKPSRGNIYMYLKYLETLGNKWITIRSLPSLQEFHEHFQHFLMWLYEVY